MPALSTLAIVGGSVAAGAIASKGASKAAKTQAKAAETASSAQVEAARISTEAQLKAVGISTEAQERAQERAIAFQQKMFDQSRADTAPWRQAGENALFKLMGGTRYGVPKPNPRDFMTKPPPLPKIPPTEEELQQTKTETVSEIQRNYQNLFGREGEPTGTKYWAESGLRGPELTQAMINAAKTYGKTYDVEGIEYENPFYEVPEEEQEEERKAEAIKLLAQWGAR